MYQKLKIKPIYDDFLKTVNITEEQKKILDMWLNKDSLIKIGDEIGVSDRTVGTEIRKLKNLFCDYYNWTVYKASILMNKDCK